MKEAWALTYCRQTGKLVHSGLKPVKEGFTTPEGGLSIHFEDGFRLTRKPFCYSPVFIHISETQVIAGGHYLSLLLKLKQIGVPLEADMDYAIDYLRYQCPWTHSTLCKQIQIIRNGEEIVIPVIGPDVRHLLPLRNSRHNIPDIRSYLARELMRLDIGKSAFHLSSGLDSSLLVLLAAEMSTAEKVTAVSCTTLGNGAGDELDLVARLATETGVRLQVHDFKAVDIVSTGKELIRQCLGYPIAHPSHLIEYWLDEAISGEFNVVVSGRGPDECLAGYAWHLPRYQDKDAYLARKRVTEDEMLCRLFKADFAMPDDGFASHVKNISGTHLSLHDRLEIDQRTIAEAWSVVQSGVELGTGITIVSPFQNAGLAEALFNLDEQQMLKNDKQKSFLRESMAIYYPNYLMNAPKRGLRLDLKQYLEKDETLLEFILESELSRLYFKKSAITEMYKQTTTGQHNYGWQLWSLFLLADAFELIYN